MVAQRKSSKVGSGLSVTPAAAQDQFDLLLAASGRLLGDLDSLALMESAIAERDLLRELINRVPDQLFVKDSSCRFLVANDAVAADKVFLDGRRATAAALIGKSDFDLYPEDIATKYRDDELKIMLTGQPVTADMRERHPDGKSWSKWVSMTKLPLRNASGKVIGLLGVGRDVTARKQAEDRLHYLAHHDPLTGLPNRELFTDRLNKAIAYAERARERVCVMFLDLDKFKLINDSLGHQAGDVFLRAAAGRISACLRPTDTVARLGGDEFVILLSDPPAGNIAIVAIAEKIMSSIAKPIEIEGQQFSVTSSLGIASFPEDGSDADGLVGNADSAMYRAKEFGRDSLQFYSASMTASATKRLGIAEGLRHAIANHELELHYQPLVEVGTGRIFGAEALLRWRRPNAELIPPLDFIPIAEETGLIVPIGKWVIDMACAQNAQWQRAGLPPVTVSVNVSARQFMDGDLVANVKAALLASRLGAKYLELELSESMIMQDIRKAIDTMDELHHLGVRLSIDDFGTGYSSLSALKSFPVERLKIDKSFVDGLATNEDDRAIATAIISLGQKLRMRVVAEGVETPEQLAFLAENGCDEAQGFHFSRPLPPALFAELLGGATVRSKERLTR